jgi:hypothetical protein
MHASIWNFQGDPDQLEPRLEALIGRIPQGSLLLMLVLRREDGFTVIDTCPDEAAYRRFRASGWMEAQCDELGVDHPTAADYPVQLAVSAVAETATSGR